MNKRIVCLLLLLPLILSCRPGRTPEPAAPPVAQSVRPAGDPVAVLEKVRTLLEGSDFESHVLTIGGKMTLAVWYVVNPEDDWYRRERAVFDAPPSPDQSALLMMNMILREIPEARECIEIFNPMLVTADHTCIMLDMIDLTKIPPEGLPDPEALIRYLRSLESRNYFYYRPEPGSREELAPDRGWERVRASVKSTLGPGNTAVYRIVGAPMDEYRPGPPTVYVQFQRVLAPGEEDSVRDGIPRFMLEMFGLLQESSPPPVSLESFWVDGTGRMLYYGKLEWRNREGQKPLPENVEVRQISGRINA